jgi:hypothetical protein
MRGGFPRLRLHNRRSGADKEFRMSINIQESFQKMPLGEKIIGIAGILFFIDSFLPWFEYDLGAFGGTVKRSGWSGDWSFLTIIAVLVAIAMVVQIGLTRFTTVQLPALPQGVTWARVHFGGAIYIAFAVLVRLLLGESAGPLDADRTYGLFIAVILAAAMVAGGFLLFQAERQGSMGSGTTTSM